MECHRNCGNPTWAVCFGTKGRAPLFSRLLLPIAVAELWNRNQKGDYNFLTGNICLKSLIDDRHVPTIAPLNATHPHSNPVNPVSISNTVSSSTLLNRWSNLLLWANYSEIHGTI